MRTKQPEKEKAIIDSAIKLFAENGFHNTKIAKIAENAGIASGSFYIYFENKEQLLTTIFDNLWSKLYYSLKDFICREDVNAVDKFDGLIDLIFDAFTANPNLAMVFVNEHHTILRIGDIEFGNYYNSFLDLGEDVIVEGIRDGLFNPNIDVKIFKTFVFGAIRHLLHQWANNQMDYSLNHIRQNVKYLCNNGISLQKEI